MSMKLVYLKDGQQAYLMQDLGENVSKRWLVDPIMTYQDHEGNYFDSESGAFKTVSEIFDKPPVAKISKELLDIKEKIAKAKADEVQAGRELYSIKTELEKRQKEASELDKWRIDLSNFATAESILIFDKKSILPIVLKKDKFRSWNSIKCTISFELVFREDWKNKLSQIEPVVKFYDGEHKSYGSALDEKYGFIFNPTDEEIKELAIKRFEEMNILEFNLHELQGFERYGMFKDNERLKAAIAVKQAENSKNAISSLEKQIADAQEKLKELKA